MWLFLKEERVVHLFFFLYSCGKCHSQFDDALKINSGNALFCIHLDCL